MNRTQVVQTLLHLYERPGYLEIGVSTGATFLAVKADRKVAVDVEFVFDTEAAAAADPTAAFRAMTSDAYFGESIAPDEAFDVIFIDGLHTFEQTLRDFCNAIGHLKPGGVIVIDDIRPGDYEGTMATQPLAIAARKARDPQNPSRDWHGDVYRLVFFIQSFFQQWSSAVPAESDNQLVVWQRRRSSASMRRRPLEKIARLPYEHTLFDRKAYKIRPMGDIVKAVRKGQSSGRKPKGLSRRSKRR